MENQHHLLQLEGHYKNKYNESQVTLYVLASWCSQPGGCEPDVAPPRGFGL